MKSNPKILSGWATLRIAIFGGVGRLIQMHGVRSFLGALGTSKHEGNSVQNANVWKPALVKNGKRVY